MYFTFWLEKFNYEPEQEMGVMYATARLFHTISLSGRVICDCIVACKDSGIHSVRKLYSGCWLESGLNGGMSNICFMSGH